MLVCVSPAVLPETLRRLAPLAPRGAIVLPHELPDPYPGGTRALCQAWAQAHGCQLLGPRSFGVQRLHGGLNLSQHPSLALSGRVALVAQSRSIAAAVMDWAEDVHAGFSTVVSLGDEAVVGLSQVLDYLASDPRSDSIVLYLEETGPAREFMSALRAAASVKPVIVLKAGRRGRRRRRGGVRGGPAARRRGARALLRAIVLGREGAGPRAPPARPARVALLSNGNGPPQLAMDLIGPDAATLPAELSPATRRALQDMLEPRRRRRQPRHQPTRRSRRNASTSLLDLLIDDAGVDGVLVLLAPDALADMPAVARQLAQSATQGAQAGDQLLHGRRRHAAAARVLDDAGTPAFRTPRVGGRRLRRAGHAPLQPAVKLLQTQPPEPRRPAARPRRRARRHRTRARRGPARARPVRDAIRARCFRVPP